ncbi:MAG: hypothetical protein AAFO89_01685 [Planctomycetota bacterium]
MRGSRPSRPWWYCRLIVFPLAALAAVSYFSWINYFGVLFEGAPLAYGLLFLWASMCAVWFLLFAPRQRGWVVPLVADCAFWFHPLLLYWPLGMLIGSSVLTN